MLLEEDHRDQLFARSKATEASSPELTAVSAQMGAVVLAAETIEITIELVTRLMAQTIPGTSGAG